VKIVRIRNPELKTQNLHLKEETVGGFLLNLGRGKGLHIIVEDGAAVEAVGVSRPLPSRPPGPLVSRRLARPRHNKAGHTSHLDKEDTGEVETE